MVAPGGGGHAWLLWGVCMVAPGGCVVAPGGGVCGCSWEGVCGCSGQGGGGGGVCMVAPGGHAWLLWGGVCGCSRGVGGMRGCSGGGEHAWLLRRDTEIRSMSGRYASYWNAFLLWVRVQSIN